MCLSSVTISSGFPVKILHIFLVFSMYVTRTLYVKIFYVITMIALRYLHLHISKYV
jgi:hypothetical protein